MTTPMRVVKLGGRAQSAAELSTLISHAWNTAAGKLSVVHGGGDEVSALQKRLGMESKFSGGRRVTSAEDIDIIRMVLSGVVNKRLVASFCAAGVPAVGISGEDASLISAQPLGFEEFGHVGMPTHINKNLLVTLLNNGFMPVISPVGCNTSDETGVSGTALNVNGDDAASAISVSLRADELLLIADVAGVLDKAGKLIAEMNVYSAHRLIEDGIAVGGMAAKLEAAHAALIGGVKRVRIANLQALNDSHCGTVIS